MKKLVLSIAIFSLMLTSVAFAGAYESDLPASYNTLGEVLKNIKLIEGSGTGLDVNGTLTREQAITILVRMNGWKEQAEAHTPTGMFSDVPLGHWSIKYVEFAAQKGLTTGIGDGKFGLGRNVTAKEFASMLLRLLGHTADWSTEDIMGKARTLALTNDAGEGKGTMLRGQTFVYMVNTLLASKAGSSEPLYVSLGIQSDYLNDAAKKIASGGTGGQSGTKRTLKIDLSKYPRVIKTDTPSYDEFRVTFNTVIASPEKKNFKFTVSDGRTIDESNWTMAPGGNSIIFRFRDQNLHGRIVTCTMNDVVSAHGAKMLGETVATVQFKDYINIQFVNVNVINEKSFEATLSTNVMPIASLENGYRVISDGVELKEGTDYKMGWGGKTFKVVLLREEVYPKREASLTVWGYVTAPYHKFMEDPVTVTADFSRFGSTEIPYVEPPAPADPVIIFTTNADDMREVINAWNESDQDPDNTDPLPVPAGQDCPLPLVFTHDYNGGDTVRFYTTAPVKEVVNPVYYGPKQEQYKIVSVVITANPDYNCFDIKFDRAPELGGYLFVEKLIAPCALETPPFDYFVHRIIN